MEKNRQIYRVFLAGIATHYREKEVFDYFKAQYPSVIKVDLIKQKDDPESSKGFGFLELTSHKEQNPILKKANFILNGRKFTAKRHRKGRALRKHKEDMENRRLFVSNVDPTVTNAVLKSFFSRIVPLEDAYLIHIERLNPSKFKQKDIHSGRLSDSKYGHLILRDPKDKEKLTKKKKFKIKSRIVFVKLFSSSKHNKKKECLEKGIEVGAQTTLYPQKESWERAPKTDQLLTRQQDSHIPARKNTKMKFSKKGEKSQKRKNFKEDKDFGVFSWEN